MDTGLLGHFGSCEYAAMNTGVEIAETPHPVLLGLRPEVGLLDDMFLVYLKNSSTVFHSSCTIACPHKQCKRDPISASLQILFFFIMIILIGVKRFKNFFFTKKRVAGHQSEEYPLSMLESGHTNFKNWEIVWL